MLYFAIQRSPIFHLYIYGFRFKIFLLSIFVYGAHNFLVWHNDLLLIQMQNGWGDMCRTQSKFNIFNHFENSKLLQTIFYSIIYQYTDLKYIFCSYIRIFLGNKKNPQNMFHEFMKYWFGTKQNIASDHISMYYSKKMQPTESRKMHLGSKRIFQLVVNRSNGPLYQYQHCVIYRYRVAYVCRKIRIIGKILFPKGKSRVWCFCFPTIRRVLNIVAFDGFLGGFIGSNRPVFMFLGTV